jgi:hypothetical protein
VSERGATFDDLLFVDSKLVSAGIDPLTPWWRPRLQEWYEHPTARTLVGRVGRGGAKSHTSSKVALTETLFGDWRVPPGERHYWAFVSTNKDEAAQRLLLLQTFLRALKVDFEVSGDTIALTNEPRGFRVFACQVGAVSGFRCFGYSADELAKWTSGNDYANPAVEVCASLNAMTITHPGARRLLISSPFGFEDYHAKAFELGNTPDQYVIHAPTWIANPRYTEEGTRKTEPDPKTHLREYGAEPCVAVSKAFDPADVARAFNRDASADLNFKGWVALDPSSLRGDGFGFMLGTTSHAEEVVILKAGEFGSDVPLRQIVATVAHYARAMNTTEVFADQREEAALTELFRLEGIKLTTYAWSEPSKREAVETVRRWLHESRLAIVPGCAGADVLKDELLRAKLRITPNGTLLYGLSGLDVLSCLATLAHAAIDARWGLTATNPLIDALARARAENGGVLPDLGLGRFSPRAHLTWGVS